MMFKNSFQAKLSVDENTTISYTTNRPFKEFKDQENILIFNYGLVCSNEHWKHQLSFFDKQNYKILIHDYRYHYQETEPQSYEELTFKNICEDIHLIIEKLKIKKGIFLGHSMGVNIALEYAYLYPEFVQGLILISGTVLSPKNVMFDSNLMEYIEPIFLALNEKFPNLVNAIWKSSHLNPLIQQGILRGGFNPKKVSVEFIKTYLENIGKLGPGLFLQLFTQMHDHSIINHIDKIKTPALIMGGNQDKVIPNHLQRILSSHLENSSLYIVKNGSHVPQVDFPDKINATIERFLHRVL